LSIEIVESLQGGPSPTDIGGACHLHQVEDFKAGTPAYQGDLRLERGLGAGCLLFIPIPPSRRVWEECASSGICGIMVQTKSLSEEPMEADSYAPDGLGVSGESPLRSRTWEAMVTDQVVDSLTLKVEKLWWSNRDRFQRDNGYGGKETDEKALKGFIAKQLNVERKAVKMATLFLRPYP
jgi:hypothetical protein